MDDFEIAVQELPITELKAKWAEAWGLFPPAKISQKMLRKSLLFKLKEQAGLGLTAHDQRKLDKLVEALKKGSGQQKICLIKPGTRLVRTWNGKRYIVLVTNGSYEYEGKAYGSLSRIATTITGTRWNGWAFFGLKKPLNVVSRGDAA